MHVEEQASRAIYARLRHRARMLRLMSGGFGALIPLTIAFGAIPYFLAGDMAVSETRAALEMRRSEAEHQAKGVEKHDTTAGEPAGSHGDPDTTTASAPAASNAAAPIAQPKERPAAAQVVDIARRTALTASDEALTAAVIRITAVVLLIALVYVFGSLYRYSMRLSSYYDEKADALRLLEAGDQRIEERLAQVKIPDRGRLRARQRARV